MRLAMRSAPATGWRWRRLSTASTDGSPSGCAWRGPPIKTCPALHVWQRCGKRSPAPRATPKTIILSENHWFSRCFRCLRKRRGKRPDRRPLTISFKPIQGICRGQNVFEKEKSQESEEGRKASCQSPCQEKGRPEEGQKGREEGCEKICQKNHEESRQEAETGTLDQVEGDQARVHAKAGGRGRERDQASG